MSETTGNTDEREAYDAMFAAVDGLSGYDAERIMAALAPIRAAEILAAEANERARIATFIWDNYSLDGCECDHGIRPPTDCPNENCNVRTAWAIHHAIERNEHGAGK